MLIKIILEETKKPRGKQENKTVINCYNLLLKVLWTSIHTLKTSMQATDHFNLFATFNSTSRSH